MATMAAAVETDASSFASTRDCFQCRLPAALSIVVLGASGDLAKKKTYPALFALYSKKYLPPNLQIVGYARSDMTAEALRERLRSFIKGSEPDVEAFLALCSYQQGEYEDTSPGYPKVDNILAAYELTFPGRPVGRLFYLALPATVYPQVCKSLRKHCCELAPGVEEGRSWTRVIVEKPFGHDLESSEILASQLGALFPEDQLYRIDHYLGKELSQNMLVMRFANPIFSSWWSRAFVSNVQLTFKENFGTQGRGGYFDSFGIIRDVIQNHLLQVLALLCMEQPVSIHPDDIRDEKLKVLRCIPPVKPEDCILGQYTAGQGQPGYLDDPTVPKGSKTPTFAVTKLFINNERWAGVPFIIKAGKAMNEAVVQVRMQLKSAAVPLFHRNMGEMRNEFVIRFQPGEAIYAKMVVKKPGLAMEAEMSELDLSYKERYHDITIPDAYERLILDCIRGDQQHFVRRDELRAAWSIFTPLLHSIDNGEITPEPYVFGTRGPEKVDSFLADAGFHKGSNYVWRPPRYSSSGPSLKL